MTQPPKSGQLVFRVVPLDLAMVACPCAEGGEGLDRGLQRGLSIVLAVDVQVGEPTQVAPPSNAPGHLIGKRISTPGPAVSARRP
jgi:hypothetical protein